MSTMLEQGVTPGMSLRTLLTLMRLAVKEGHSYVRYCEPAPQEYGLFIREGDPVPAFPEPRTLSIAQLLGDAFVVVAKIEQWHQAMIDAQNVQERLEQRVQFLMRKFDSYGIDPDYVAPPPPVYYVKDDNGNFVEAKETP